MLRIDVDDFPSAVEVTQPRRSFTLPFSTSKIIDGLSRKNSLYDKLPEDPLRLSVLKLDGSSFDIDVMKNASIKDLKSAVEIAFSHMPRTGPGKVSWPHVWAHFCLSYCGQKLLSEDDYIGMYGIRDGDQLYFVRHVSNFYLSKRKSKKRLTSSKQLKLFPQQDTYVENDHKLEMEDGDVCDDIENGRYLHFVDSKDSDMVAERDYSIFSDIIRGIICYSKLSSEEKETSKHQVTVLESSKYGCGFFFNVREVIRLYTTKSCFERVALRED